MSSASIFGFQGLDLRRLQEVSDPRTARRAINVDLTLGREFVARDGLRPLMPLHPQSKGLYAIGGTLRAVIPGGQSLPAETDGPVRVKYDQLGFGDGNYTSIMVSVRAGVVATLEGAVWPDAMPGRLLTIGAYTYTVVSVSGLDVTVSSPLLNAPGVYDFFLGGTPTVSSRTISVANGSDVVTLTGGTWPDGLDNSTFTILSAGFSARVVAKLSATQLRLDTTLATGTLTAVDFTVSGLAAAYPLDTLVRVAATESIGASASFGSYPYLSIERWVDAENHELGTTFEHHWITRESSSGTDVLATQVRLPFAPGASLIQMAGKLWAADDVNGVVRFSSTANGPRDWTTMEDAGYIPVISHTSGDRKIQGLGTYDDKLAVIFSDAVQLWAADPQPTNITLVRVIDGPGTTSPQSVVNVLGDLFYYTRGGIRSMHTQTVTGQIQEQDDIGGPIDSLVKAETDPVTAAWWSQVRGQYLCAFGSRVYAFRYSPKSKVQGWTTWELGTPVDAVAELGGKTYIRSNDHLYVLEAGYDDGSTYEVTLNDFTAKNPANRKRVDFLEVVQRGTTTLRTYLEPDSDDYYLDGPTLVGTTIKLNRCFVGAMARTFGFRFTGKGPWTLSSLQVTFLPLPW
jgi:hypothetical protein